MTSHWKVFAMILHGCTSVSVWMYLVRRHHSLLVGAATIIGLFVVRALLSILLITNVMARKMTIFFAGLFTIFACTLILLGAQSNADSKDVSSAVSFIWVDIVTDLAFYFVVFRTFFVGNDFLRDATLNSGSVANVLQIIGKSQSARSGIFCCACLQELSLGDDAVVLLCHHIMHYSCADNRASQEVVMRRMMCPMRCDYVAMEQERIEAQFA
eukprot:TRINITY_DN30607_c0_g1_i2.p1 TRINITY_DN30607_c0_g1~~TRINITY_DN30607_c0_g1_i2.p1  ORF type:complete len:213 (-),score=25.77 TRINITY_DN30607_c0_g1_i2:292-930(-)